MAKKPFNHQTPGELRAALAQARGKLAELRQELIGKRLSDTSQVGQVRKEIARILTALNKSA